MKGFLRRMLGQKLINYYHLAEAIVANLFYGFPSRQLHVIGITGTDGKTTTVNLIARIFQAAHMPTSFLSSINAQIGQAQFDTGLHTTTPSPFLLQKLLRKMLKAGSKYVVLEVTSHSLDQYRTWGVRFETAVLTNITHEHLDYHKTYKRYLEAKTKLFKDVRFAVLNREDESYTYLSVAVHNSPHPSLILREGVPPLKVRGGEGELLLTYGLTDSADIWADQIKEDLASTTFKVHIPNSTFNVQLNFPGRFNVLNALAAIAVGQIYNISQEAIALGLESVKQIPGRMEYIEEEQNFLAMVDFAHTPNALSQLLNFLRPKISGQLILVFGSAGERDRTKRPLMGEAADKYADLIVITREDNRSEDVMEISRQIASGIKKKKLNEGYYIIPDRREAIRFVLSQAHKGDLFVATGKGHEQSLNIDGQELPWDDREVMREELRALRNTNTPTLSPPIPPQRDRGR